MFLERIAVLTLQVRAKLLAFFNFLLKETDSQLGQIFFTCCLFLFTGLLFYAWEIPSPLWLKIVFSILYLIFFLLCASAIYFLVRRKRIRNNSGAYEVYSLDSIRHGKFQHLSIEAIPLTQEQLSNIFTAFSEKYIDGTFQSFQSLVLLQPISDKERLRWKDLSPKRPKQVNRQTLLEFLSHLLIGFKKLDNHQMILLVEHYFTLANPETIEQHVSSKNISDWRINESPYLDEISLLLKKHL